MKTLANILLIIVLVVAALAIKDRYFPSTVVKTKTVTQIDTIWQDSIVYKQLPAPDPDTIVLHDTIINTVTEPVSSGKYNALARRFMKLHNAHNSSNIYNRTLIDDSTALIRVTDTVRENLLQKFDFSYKNRTPTVINNKTIIKNQRKYFAGAQFGTHTIQPEFMYKDLSDNIYMLGYDFQGPDQGPRFGIYTSISNFKIW